MVKKKSILALIISAVMVFGMAPMAVFAASDSEITTDMPTTAVVGQEIEYGVTTTAGTDQGKYVLAKFNITGPAAVTTKYLEVNDNQWYELTGDSFGPPSTGFPFTDGATSKFRSTFNQAGTYTFEIQIVAVADQSVLARATHTVTVTDPVAPAVTIDMPQTFIVGEPMEFTISTTAGSQAGTMVLGTAQFDGAAAVEKIEYLETADGKWYELTGDSFGPASGFSLADATSTFRVTFNQAGTFSLVVNIVDAATQQTVIASAKSTVTSDTAADYTAVDAAIAKANALNRDDYVDFTAVDNAIVAVVRDLGSSRQEEVNAMAQAIEDAIAGLQLKQNDTTGGTATGGYQITAGADGVWVQNSADGLTITSNGDFTKFTGIKVDGADVAAEHYTAVSGSTVVTLNAAYLQTLTEGTHTFTMVFTDGEVSTNFTVSAQAAGTANNTMASPQTGDSSSVVLWAAIAVAAAGAMAGAVVFARKKKAE